MGAPRSFGIWDGLFLWSLLSNLNRPGAADFFHNQRNDPGYQEWRAEVDRMAAQDPSLQGRLADLDQQLAARQAQPVDASYLPPGVPRDVALAPTAAERTPSLANGEEDGTPWLTIAIVLSLGIVGWLAWQRFRGGVKKDGSMRNLGTAGAMLRRKLSGESYRPDRLRVGMTFPFDPTPFVLASGATKVVPPAPDTGSRQLTVTAIGTLEGDGATLTRLYLPDERSVFQLHLDGSGSPDECRFFSIIDQVTPADQAEWGVWLNPSDGMIGWPQFQTRDGKLYDRIWAPGGARIAPMMMTETIETADPHPRQLRRQTMLYAAQTGAAEPAPHTEYILVTAIEDGRQAWVEIAAGIDVNPGMLALS